MAFVKNKYMPAKTIIINIAVIHMVFCFVVSDFILVYNYNLFYYSFSLRFYSINLNYSCYLCLIFDSYFYFLRTIFYSCLLFYISISFILLFYCEILINSIVCPFLFLIDKSIPSLSPNCSNFLVIVCKSFRHAS